MQRALFREAIYMLHDKFDAEDAVQTLYLRLWERKDELDRLISPEKYCFAMLRNICIDRIRQYKVRDEEILLIEEIPDAAPPDIEVSETRQCLEEFMYGVPEPQRTVMLMRMDGCSYEEIENVTGLSQINIRVIISRVRKRFRNYYCNIK